LIEEPLLLAGGGATHVALARRLRRYGETIPGREQLAIEAFADALEIIPRVLAENAGLDPINTLLEIVAAQSNASEDISHYFGLNVNSRKSTNMVDDGILEPLRITRQAISGATEAAVSILRIDDVLWAKADAAMPDMPEMD
jgi:chaperonin GroEL (HSP60 family)